MGFLHYRIVGGGKIRKIRRREKVQGYNLIIKKVSFGQPPL